MANIKLSDLPLVASPATDATVVGINNGAASRFAYNSGSSEESAVPWKNIEKINIDVTIGEWSSTSNNTTFTMDFTGKTFVKDTLYIPMMQFTEEARTAHSVLENYYHNKVMNLSYGVNAISWVYVTLPKLDFPLYLLYDHEPYTGNESYSTSISTIYSIEGVNRTFVSYIGAEDYLKYSSGTPSSKDCNLFYMKVNNSEEEFYNVVKEAYTIGYQSYPSYIKDIERRQVFAISYYP